MTSKELAQIIEFLARDHFDGFTSDDLFIKKFIKKAWGQDIAALSNMAEGLCNIAVNEPGANADMVTLTEQVIHRALHRSVNPWKKPIDQVIQLGHFGYYLEHLNIILGCYHRIGGRKYAELYTRVTLHLREASLKQENAHARLLPHVKMRWSADQAAILYSIWLYDQNHETELSREPVERWLTYMHDCGTHERTGLFITEVMGTKKYSKQPRGCSSAYMIYYMSHFAEETARTQWLLFKRHMGLRFLFFQGFREYLPEFKGRWTPDSGPIIGGLGVAATGLALKTSAALDEQAIFKSISRLASIGTNLLRSIGWIPVLGHFTKIGTDLLASSIILAAKTR